MKNSGNIALVISLALLAYFIYDKTSKQTSNKIGVVQMEKLVYDFKGMKEASNSYADKMKNWNLQSDSLESKLKDMYNQVRIDSINKDQNKLNKDIQVFMLFKQSYLEYMQNMQANADKEDKQMTLGVVNQVNEYIKTYAVKEGYDVILCNSQQQSVGYVKGALDVTAQVLEYANKQYEGEK